MKIKNILLVGGKETLICDKHFKVLYYWPGYMICLFKKRQRLILKSAGVKEDNFTILDVFNKKSEVELTQLWIEVTSLNGPAFSDFISMIETPDDKRFDYEKSLVNP